MTKPNSISKIELRGFQTHRNFALDLKPGVTTIIGPSDVGKSAVLRAIKWLAQNVPSGDSFIRWGEENARVRLTLSDGTVLRRTKGKTRNLYWRGDRKYAAFGNAVPPEVESALKIGAENFQGQYDRPFWIGETAGEISRQLNRVVNLGVIDYVLKELTTSHRRVTVEVDLTKERLQEWQGRKDQWGFSHEMDQDLSQVEAYEKQRDGMAEKVVLLASERVHGLLARKDIRDSVKVVIEGRGVLKIASEWEAHRNDAEKLKGLVDKAHEQAEVLGRPIPDLNDLENLRGWAAALELKAEALTALLLNAGRVRVECIALDLQVSLSEIELRKELGDICPLCNQPIQL